MFVQRFLSLAESAFLTVKEKELDLFFTSTKDEIIKQHWILMQVSNRL